MSQIFVSYMRFGPEDEDLSHHAEQLLSIWVRARQPSCSKTHAKCKMSRELKNVSIKKNYTGNKIPVVIYIADKKRVQRIQVSTENCKFISYSSFLLVPLRLPLHTQVLLLSHYFSCTLLQLLHGGNEMGFEHLWFGSAHNRLGEHWIETSMLLCAEDQVLNLKCKHRLENNNFSYPQASSSRKLRQFPSC